MIEFARGKAQRKGIDAKFVLGDMRDLDRGLGRFDLVYVLLGSLYVRGPTSELLDHLDRVADLLGARRRFICWIASSGSAFSTTIKQKLDDQGKGGVKVHTRYRAEMLDPIAQTYMSVLTFTVDDHGKRRDHQRAGPGEGLLSAGIPVPRRTERPVRIHRLVQ